MLESLFGSKSAARVLLFLQNYGEGYGREIAQTFGAAPLSIQNQLQKFETGGWVVARSIGRTRMYAWNPRNPLVKELRSFLQATLDALPDGEVQAYYRQRRRPRRSGKPL